MSKATLYINSKGYPVTRHSYSGGDSFNFCNQRYYLERVQGWSEKQERAATKFGIALEDSVKFWHQRGQHTDAAVAEFQHLWLEHKDKEYIYSKPEKDWASLNLTGSELVRLYAILYPTLPFIVNNPLDFQVNTNFEVFPGTKLAGIEFTSYIDLIASVKKEQPQQPNSLFQSVPEAGEPLIIDIKTSGKDIPELLVLDPQLRSYAWVKSIPLVAFLWFRKMGREISKGDTATILEFSGGLLPGTSVTVLGRDALGYLTVTPNPKIVDEMNEKFVGTSKAVTAARTDYMVLNGVVVPESQLTKQRVQFKMAKIPVSSRDDIGRSIKRDIINIVSANEQNFWPLQSGVRFPNEKCPNCAMRGICSDNPTLRDELVERKGMADVLDFGGEAE